MDQTVVLELARQGINTALMIALPILSVGLIVGILVSVFQAVTQVQEPTLTFVPKLLAIVLVFIFLGNWMLTILVAFFKLCFDHMARIAQ